MNPLFNKKKTSIKSNEDTFAAVPMEITIQRMKDLLCTAFEGGSNYWIDHIEAKGKYKKSQIEYIYDVPILTKGWLEIHDIDDPTIIKLDSAALKKGLNILAKLYPQAFSDFINENEDAETADVFLQCCCFGEVIYG